jgi:hypothetical protein
LPTWAAAGEAAIKIAAVMIRPDATLSKYLLRMTGAFSNLNRDEVDHLEILADWKRGLLAVAGDWLLLRLINSTIPPSTLSQNHTLFRCRELPMSQCQRRLFRRSLVAFLLMMGMQSALAQATAPSQPVAFQGSRGRVRPGVGRSRWQHHPHGCRD